MLLAVTNSYEGYNFVNSATPPTNLTTYVTDLFPLINETIVQTIVETYLNDTTLTNTSSQAIAIMGECEQSLTSARTLLTRADAITPAIFICPTYLLMGAFGDKAYKVP